MNADEKKEIIEKICSYAETLIRNCEYADNPRQLIDYAKKELGVNLTCTELDRLVRKYMRMSNRTQRGLDAESVAYEDLQDYIDRKTVAIRREQHGEGGGGKIQLSDLLKIKFKPQF